MIADKLPLTLDRNGAGKLTIEPVPPRDAAARTAAGGHLHRPERRGADAAQHLRLWPAGVVAGIKTEGWVSAAQQMRFQALALDLTGKPQAGVALDVQGRWRASSPRASAWSAASTPTTTGPTRKDLGTLCSGNTDARGLLLCDAKLASPARWNWS